MRRKRRRRRRLLQSQVMVPNNRTHSIRFNLEYGETYTDLAGHIPMAPLAWLKLKDVGVRDLKSSQVEKYYCALLTEGHFIMCTQVNTCQKTI